MTKQLTKKILYGYRASSTSYITYLKNAGIEVGENVRIFVPK